MLLCRQCCSGWVPQAGLFTGSGVAMMTWRLCPLAFMTQSLSMWAWKSWQPTRISWPSGEYTGLNSPNRLSERRRTRRPLPLGWTTMTAA